MRFVNLKRLFSYRFKLLFTDTESSILGVPVVWRTPSLQVIVDIFLVEHITDEDCLTQATVAKIFIGFGHLHEV